MFICDYASGNKLGDNKRDKNDKVKNFFQKN